MTPRDPARALADAVDVFKELGWDRGTPADVGTLPAGTPEQLAVARRGLAKGRWVEPATEGRELWGRIGSVDVDETMLALFAVHAGVSAARIIELRGDYRSIPDAAVARLIAQHGREHAERFVAAAHLPMNASAARGTTRDGAVALRLVDDLDLPLPAVDSYYEDWVLFTLIAVEPSLADRDTDPSLGLSHRYPPPAERLDLATVTRRFREHVTGAIARGLAPGWSGLSTLVPLAVERALLSHDEAVELVVTAVDAARGPSDRNGWTGLLTAGLGVTGARLVPHGAALLGAIAAGDGPIVSTLGPALVAEGDDSLMAEVLTAALPTTSKKNVTLLLAAAATRARPPTDIVDAVTDLLEPYATGKDGRLVPAAARLVTAWSLDVGASAASAPTVTAQPATASAVARGWWQPTPPVWDVPRLDLSNPTAEALSAAASTLMRRSAEVHDADTDLFLGLATALARTDRAAAHEVLAGIGRQFKPGLQYLDEWVAAGARPVYIAWAETPEAGFEAEPWIATARRKSVLAARDIVAVENLAGWPSLLSSPTWVDLRIDPADLAVRLTEYAAAGVAALEPDLQLALTRLDLSLVTQADLAAMDRARVPVVLRSGASMSLRAGELVRRYVDAPFQEPQMRLDDGAKRWTRGSLERPPSLVGLPPRFPLRDRDRVDAAVFPTWGDVTAYTVHDEPRVAGVVLRQLARRATPLTPGQAMTMIAAQRRFVPSALEDGTTAVVEAWQRGLLRPGVADVWRLDWRSAPSGLAGLARACLEIAPEGLASVVWHVLADVLLASAQAPRLFTGTADVLQALVELTPEAKAAVANGVAGAEVLELPGAREIARRGGTSMAVRLARELVAEVGDVRHDVAAPV